MQDSTQPPPSQGEIAFLITESSYFLSHRQPLGEACRAMNWRTTLILNVADADRPALRDYRLIPFDIRRASHQPLREMMTLLRLVLLFWRERPKILHAVGLKPVLYGAFAGKLLGLNTICALGGLGYLFMSDRLTIQVLRHVIVWWMRFVFRHRKTWLILQNDDDAEKLLVNKIISPDRLCMIRGSGVDLTHFRPTPEPQGIPVFTVTARMLADKGIREVVMAARQLRWRGVACRVLLVGDIDEHNPSSLTRAQLQAWHREGVVEWLGLRQDIAEIWAASHVCVLPSYREGLPKALLEAAACGRPIITTDVPGCRAVVSDGVEGILVPVQDWSALADAMEKLATSPKLREQMGRAARAGVEAEFGQEVIVDQTIALYQRVLDASCASS